MIRNIRLGAAGFFTLLAVMVDFASRLMSVLTDGALLAVAVVILLPLLKKQ
ncbi:DUF3927 family protein [Cronobacter sakazakii]